MTSEMTETHDDHCKLSEITTIETHLGRDAAVSRGSGRDNLMETTALDSPDMNLGDTMRHHSSTLKTSHRKNTYFGFFFSTSPVRVSVCLILDSVQGIEMFCAGSTKVCTDCELKRILKHQKRAFNTKDQILTNLMKSTLIMDKVCKMGNCHGQVVDNNGKPARQSAAMQTQAKTGLRREHGSSTIARQV